jgi:hypothetical protein
MVHIKIGDFKNEKTLGSNLQLPAIGLEPTIC